MGWLAGREWIWIVISFVLGLILTWFWLVQKVSARVPAGTSGSGRGAAKRSGLGATASGIGAAGAAGAKGLKDKAGDAGESGISAAKRAVGRDE